MPGSPKLLLPESNFSPEPASSAAEFNLAPSSGGCGEWTWRWTPTACAALGDPQCPQRPGTGWELRARREANATLRTALASKTCLADAWNNLGAALKDQGEIEEAAACLENAVRLQPENHAFHSNLVFVQHYRVGTTPVNLLGVARRWNDVHAAALESRQQPARQVAAAERLRIAYVSGNFAGRTVQALFTVPLLPRDHAPIPRLCAIRDVTDPDAVTGCLRAAADRWRDIAGLADEQVAEIIRQDGIDVLVDLTGTFPHVAQPASGFCPQTGASSGHLAWLPRHHRPDRDGLPLARSIGWSPTVPATPATQSLPIGRPRLWCYAPLTEAPLSIRSRL